MYNDNVSEKILEIIAKKDSLIRKHQEEIESLQEAVKSYKQAYTNILRKYDIEKGNI